MTHSQFMEWGFRLVGIIFLAGGALLIWVTYKWPITGE